MHPKFAKADLLSKEVISAAIEVHRQLGPGLMESIYQKCLCRELDLRSIPFVMERIIVLTYKGASLEEKLKLDFLVDDCLALELKCVEKVIPAHKAQLISYMKLLDAPVGLLINFHEILLKSGISRCILPGADVQNPERMLTEGCEGTEDRDFLTEGSEGSKGARALAVFAIFC
jgi:GxxExxY protein